MFSSPLRVGSTPFPRTRSSLIPDTPPRFATLLFSIMPARAYNPCRSDCSLMSVVPQGPDFGELSCTSLPHRSNFRDLLGKTPTFITMICIYIICLSESHSESKPWPPISNLTITHLVRINASTLFHKKYLMSMLNFPDSYDFRFCQHMIQINFSVLQS